MAGLQNLFNLLCSKGNDVLWHLLQYFIALTTSSLPPHQKDTTYVEKLTKLIPEAKEVLDNYVGLPGDEHIAHVLKVRDKAWNVCPYSCVGTFGFTSPSIQVQFYYPSLLNRIKNGDKCLDLGCGLGQNVRKIVHDCGPSSNIFGSDLLQDLIDCGYDYFIDKQVLESRFFTGDLLNAKSSNFKKIEGTFDVLFTACLYHLWSWDVQLQASIASTKLLKPKPGAVIFGWQIGASPGKEISRNLDENRAEHTTMYRHDNMSLTKLWDLVGEKTGTKWVVEAENGIPSWIPAEYRGPLKRQLTAKIITFTIKRVE